MSIGNQIHNSDGNFHLAISILGILMILIGWWRQSRWEEKMLSDLTKNQDEKT
mgnify:CR=1